VTARGYRRLPKGGSSRAYSVVAQNFNGPPSHTFSDVAQLMRIGIRRRTVTKAARGPGLRILKVICVADVQLQARPSCGY
jgi:hypothetical protein